MDVDDVPVVAAMLAAAATKVTADKILALSSTLPVGVTTVAEPESDRWLTTMEVAERTAMHRVTVSRALSSGTMHGHRAGHGGRWRVRPQCVDAWMSDVSPRAALGLCGCERKSPAR